MQHKATTTANTTYKHTNIQHTNIQIQHAHPTSISQQNCCLCVHLLPVATSAPGRYSGAFDGAVAGGQGCGECLQCLGGNPTVGSSHSAGMVSRVFCWANMCLFCLHVCFYDHGGKILGSKWTEHILKLEISTSHGRNPGPGRCFNWSGPSAHQGRLLCDCFGSGCVFCGSFWVWTYCDVCTVTCFCLLLFVNRFYSIVASSADWNTSSALMSHWEHWMTFFGFSCFRCHQIQSLSRSWSKELDACCAYLLGKQPRLFSLRKLAFQRCFMPYQPKVLWQGIINLLSPLTQLQYHSSSVPSC